MSRSINTAVILAAGMGQRLQDAFNEKPKGFLQLGNKPIIEESIEKLQKLNIENIIIVTGHLSNFYEDLAKKDARIQIVKNEKYAQSGSLYSLLCAKDIIQEDFFLLESDIIYEQKALEILLSSEKEDVILLSGFTGNGDEVFVETNENQCLVTISKNKDTLKSIEGELVGISKISLDSLQKIDELNASALKQNHLNLDYETDGLVQLAKNKELYCHTVDNLIWSEIDDPTQLAKAKDTIYPKIVNQCIN